VLNNIVHGRQVILHMLQLVGCLRLISKDPVPAGQQLVELLMPLTATTSLSPGQSPPQVTMAAVVCRGSW
jgi:hypothetical protein